MTLPNIEAKPAPEPLRHPEKAARPDQPSPRKPPWIRVKAPTSPEYQATRRLMRELKLNTVCEEAACPNIGECWKEKHATGMILGAVCTRACTFCNVATRRPHQPGPHEAARLGGARAADDDRGARARFPAQGRRHRDRRRGEARCSQPQSRNRAAALCRGASRRALFPFIALARPREASGPDALHKIRAHGRARRGAP